MVGNVTEPSCRRRHFGIAGVEIALSDRFFPIPTHYYYYYYQQVKVKYSSIAHHFYDIQLVPQFGKMYWMRDKNTRFDNVRPYTTRHNVHFKLAYLPADRSREFQHEQTGIFV